MRDQPAFGTIAEAAGGLRFITGEPDRPPARVGLSLGDSIASLHAVIGALMALHEREASGRGQVVDVALTESLFSMLEGILPEYSYFGVGPPAHRQHRAQLGADERLPMRRRVARVHRGQHDRPVPGRCSESSVERLAADPALATNEGRVGRASELDEAIGAWTRTPYGRRGRRHAARAPGPGQPHQQHRRHRGRPPVPGSRHGRGGRSTIGSSGRCWFPGVVPKLSRTPGRVPPLAQPLGAATDAIRGRQRAPMPVGIGLRPRKPDR